MKLIICEKYDLAKKVASAIGIKEKHNNHFETNDYLVAFASGHLLTLKDINEYSGYSNFKWSQLQKEPFIPTKFEYKIGVDRSGTTDNNEKLLNGIKKLVQENNFESIINCGDADREGQIIIDNIIDYINYNGKVERLWLPEQTPETIREQLENLKSNDDYRNLNLTGLARTYLDWLMGVNLTIFITNKRGEKLNVGRVLIPIVKYIYDRDEEIKNFIPSKYYQIENQKNVKLACKEKYEINEIEKANHKIQELNKNKAKIIDIENKKIIKNPNKLFSLSTLQSFLSKKYKINFKKSLDIIQKLYEKGFLTYPRTNTEYLAETEKDRIRKIINILNEKLDVDLELKETKKIFDSRKVESHSAITPTQAIPNLAELDETAKIVYEVVLNRFLSNFTKEKTIIIEKIMNIQIGEEIFSIKGSTIKEKGFLKYEPIEIKDELPNYQINDEFDVDFKLIEKITKAPNKITESSLSNYLKNPFKKENKEDDTEEYTLIKQGVEIGTEATRTGIIEKAKKLDYIKQDKDKYSITPKGEKLIEILNNLEINLYAEKSIEFSKSLKEVFNGTSTIENCLQKVEKELQNIFQTNKTIEKVEKKIKEEVILGKCPKCGNNVVARKTKKDNKIFYTCVNSDFFLWENYKYFSQNLKITKVKIKKLLNNEKVIFKLKSKAGKDYETYMKLEINGNYINLKQDGYVNK